MNNHRMGILGCSFLYQTWAKGAYFLHDGLNLWLAKIVDGVMCVPASSCMTLSCVWPKTKSLMKLKCSSLDWLSKSCPYNHRWSIHSRTHWGKSGGLHTLWWRCRWGQGAGQPELTHSLKHWTQEQGPSLGSSWSLETKKINIYIIYRFSHVKITFRLVKNDLQISTLTIHISSLFFTGKNNIYRYLKLFFTCWKKDCD